MVRVAKHRFVDAHQYEAAIRAANVRGLSTTRGKFNADLLKVDFERLWMQSGQESLPISSHIDVPGDRAPIFFLTGSGEPSIQTSGLDLVPGQLLFWKGGSSHYQRVQRGRWGSMSLTPADLATASIALVGKSIAPPNDTTIFKPTEGSMERLMSLHAEARRLAEEAPDRISHPEVGRALENALVESMISCLSVSEEGSLRVLSHVHTRIMQRFEELVFENAGRPLYLPEVCKKVGASERTLRRCCQEQLGVAPNRYLLLRRLHLAHRELMVCDPRAVTVTEVATSFGFWQLGRFAGAYRALFGESPIETLRRPRAH